MALIEKDVKTIEELKTVIGHGGKAAVLYDATTGEPYGLDMEVLINMDSSIQNKVEKVTGKSLIADTEIARLSGVTNQTLSGLGGEPAANKQDSLAVDGTGVKFPTVDAVNAAIGERVLKTSIVGERSQSTTTVPSSKLLDDELTNVTNTERPIADIFAYLLGRIQTLEELLVASRYNSIQVNELSVVDNLKFKGADLFLFGTEAPAVTPDFIGQFFIDTTAGVTYQAKGITNAADWKATSNA